MRMQRDRSTSIARRRIVRRPSSVIQAGSQASLNLNDAFPQYGGRRYRSPMSPPAPRTAVTFLENRDISSNNYVAAMRQNHKSGSSRVENCDSKTLRIRRHPRSDLRRIMRREQKLREVESFLSQRGTSDECFPDVRDGVSVELANDDLMSVPCGDQSKDKKDSQALHLSDSEFTQLIDPQYCPIQLKNEVDWVNATEEYGLIPAEEGFTPCRRVPSRSSQYANESFGSKGIERLPFTEHYEDLAEANFASLIVDCRGERREVVMLRGSFRFSEITRFEPWVLARTKFSKLFGGNNGHQSAKLQKLHLRLLQSVDAIDAPWIADSFRVNRADGSWFKAVLVFIPISIENETGAEILCLMLNADEPGSQTERDACVDLIQNGRSESILLAAAHFLSRRKAQVSLALNFEPRVPLVIL